MRKILLCLLISLSIAACSPNAKELNITTEVVNQPILHPPSPRPLELNDITFKVVTSDNLPSIIKEIQKQQNSEFFVFYLITPRDYETLSLNMQEIKRYIQQQKSIILFYRDTIVNE